MNVSVKFEVPEFLVPMLTEMSRLSSLSTDEIAQRALDQLGPRLLAGEDVTDLTSMSAIFGLLPELKEATDKAFASAGLTFDIEGRSSEEILQAMMGLSIVCMVLGSAAEDDAVAEPLEPEAKVAFFDLPVGEQQRIFDALQADARKHLN